MALFVIKANGEDKVEGVNQMGLLTGLGKFMPHIPGRNEPQNAPTLIHSPTYHIPPGIAEQSRILLWAASSLANANRGRGDFFLNLSVK